MKEFRDHCLCSFRNEQVSVFVSADLIDGKLTIKGDDVGPLVESWFGDSDLEYWYTFSAEETEKLFRALNALNDPAGALREHFSGEEGCRNLRTFCETYAVRYTYFSYA